MKRILFVVLLLSSSSAFAQQFNFHRYSFGVSSGMTHAFTDVPEMKFAPGFSVNADFFYTPFTATSLDLQFGSIKGGNPIVNIPVVPNGTTLRHGREFNNTFFAATLNNRIALAQLVYYEDSRFTNAIRGLYLGLGVGVIQNNVKAVRVQPRQPYQTEDYIFPGHDHSVNLSVPLSVGINFEFKDVWGETRYLLGFNYQSSLTFGEGLDGYDDPSDKFKNKGFDMYNAATVSLKYCFGPLHGFYRP